MGESGDVSVLLGLTSTRVHRGEEENTLGKVPLGVGLSRAYGYGEGKGRGGEGKGLCERERESVCVYQGSKAA